MKEAGTSVFSLDQCRRFYAEEIRFVAGGCSDALASAFAEVPRELFVGPSPWKLPTGNMLAQLSYSATSEPRDVYHDVVVALDESRQLNSAQPSVMMRLLMALDLASGKRVLHIGCGVGYYTAILAEVVGPQGTVVAIEADPQLAERAHQNLARYKNVQVIPGDGASFQPNAVDAILVNAGITHPHPAWLEGLAAEGVLVAPFFVGPDPAMREALALRLARRGAGFSAQPVCSLAIYPSTSQRDPAVQQQWAASIANRSILRLQSARCDVHTRDESCLVHTEGFCLSAEACSES